MRAGRATVYVCSSVVLVRGRSGSCGSGNGCGGRNGGSFLYPAALTPASPLQLDTRLGSFQSCSAQSQPTAQPTYSTLRCPPGRTAEGGAVLSRQACELRTQGPGKCNAFVTNGCVPVWQRAAIMTGSDRQASPNTARYSGSALGGKVAGSTTGPHTRVGSGWGWCEPGVGVAKPPRRHPGRGTGGRAGVVLMWV